MLDNPVMMVDPDGRFPIIPLAILTEKVLAAGVGVAWEYGSQVYANRSKGQSWADAAWNNIDQSDIYVEAISFAIPEGRALKVVTTIGGEFLKEAVDWEVNGTTRVIGDENKKTSDVLKNTAVNSTIAFGAGKLASDIKASSTEEAVGASVTALSNANKRLAKAQNVAAAGGPGSPGARSYKGPTTGVAANDVFNKELDLSATVFRNVLGLGKLPGEEVAKKTIETTTKTVYDSCNGSE